MISVEEALARLKSQSRVLVDEQKIKLDEGLGRVLASDIVSGINVPPEDNSAMDGYALRWEDWRGSDHALKISQRIAAGTPPAPLTAGTAARIFTGAEIPDGADVVVMQEKCRADGQSGIGGTGRHRRSRPDLQLKPVFAQGHAGRVGL
jgi:molybdopterin molybdotransferase